MLEIGGYKVFLASSAGGAGAVLGVFVLIFLCLGVLWWWSFIDALVTPTSAWEKIDRSRGAWVVLLLVFGVIASFPYMIAIRPKLIAAKRS